MLYKMCYCLIKSQALVTYSNSAGNHPLYPFCYSLFSGKINKKEYRNFHHSSRCPECPQIIPCGAGWWGQSQALSSGLPSWSKGCVCSQPLLTVSQDEWLHTDHCNCLTVPGEMLFKLKDSTGTRTNVSKLDIIAFTLVIKRRFLIKLANSSQND